MGRIRTGTRTVVLLAALLLTGACADDSRDGATESATGTVDTPSDPPSPTPELPPELPPEQSSPSGQADPADRVPLQAERPAESFTEGIDRFLKRIADYLETREPPGTEDTMVTIGQETCSAVSSGGMVAAKVDFWAGQRALAGDEWDPVIVGGILDLCPQYQAGYVADRQLDIEPSGPERADLVRYVVRRSLGVDTFGSKTDRAIERAAAKTCDTAATDPGAFSDLDPIADRERVAAILGLILAYCEDLSDSVVNGGLG